MVSEFCRHPTHHQTIVMHDSSLLPGMQPRITDITYPGDASMPETFYAKLLESLFDGVYYVDLNKNIQVWNKGAERITGFTKEEVIGSCCSNSILRHIDDDGQELCATGCALSATMQDGKMRESNIYLHHKLGHRVPVSVRVAPVRDDAGEIIGGVEIFSDNSSSMQIIRELELLKQEAYLDQLTSVGNRRYGEITLKTRIFELTTHGIPFGVMFLDIDHFKVVNDSFGHKTGDEVLAMVGKTIASVFRRSDTVFRWGGEEFVVIFNNASEKNLRQLAERLRIFVERGFITKGSSKITVTASIGATLARLDDTPESIINRADTLMYASKSAGRNCVTIG